MKNTFSTRAASAALVLTTVLATFATAPVYAQAPASAAPATSSGKTIGDWGVQCVASAPCEMQQTATQKKTGRRISSVSLAFVPQNDRYILQIAVPLGVALAKGVKIIATGYNGGAMAFRRCDATGCYVEGLLDGKMVDALARARDPAKLQIVSVEGKTVDLPLSLRGFAEARKNMEDLARQKAPKP